jgi:hypothetical protein
MLWMGIFPRTFLKKMDATINSYIRGLKGQDKVFVLKPAGPVDTQAKPGALGRGFYARPSTAGNDPRKDSGALNRGSYPRLSTAKSVPQTKFGAPAAAPAAEAGMR